jgi:hypothetical protein
MSQQSSRLQLPYLASGQAQKHVTMNESLLRLDALVQLSVVSAVVTSQPGSPTDGDLYILPAGKSGSSWGAMADGAIAYYRDGAWEEITPREGFVVHVDDVDQIVVYSGAAWQALTSTLRVTATDRLLGRISSGAGAAEEVTFTDQAQQLCDDTSFQAMCATLGTWRVLARSAVAASVTGTTSETALATISVPAAAMGPNGVLRVTSIWSVTNGANNKILRTRFGGVSGTPFLAATLTTTASLHDIRHIANRNSASSQVGAPTTPTSTFSAQALANQTAAVNTASAADLVISGQLANAGDTITLEYHCVEVAYGA